MKLGPLTIERRRPLPVGSSESPRTLDDVLVDNRFVDFTNDGSALIVTPREPEDRARVQMAARNLQSRGGTEQLGSMGANSSASDAVAAGEIGFMGASIWYNLLREDYNPQMRGVQGLRKFDEMRRNDAQVRASLRLFKTPVLAARWFVQPASPSPQDKKIAEFVWNNYTRWMTISWNQVLIESLLCCDFGYYMFEKVYDFHPNLQNKVIWKKLAPRHPLDVIKWEYDKNGGPKEAWFYNPSNAQGTPISIAKLLVFSFDREANNIGGISVLRSAYKHWYIKEALYKIDAIQKERHGVGLPIICLPPNFSDQDRVLANDMGRNLRTNEKAHIVLPPNWSIEFAQVTRGAMTDAIKSIEHHDNLIARNVLGQFIDASMSTQKEESTQLFLKATRFLAESIRDIHNKYAIPELVNFNWKNVEDYPELRVRRIGDAIDWRAVSFAIRNFIGAGCIVPDAALEDWIRDEMDMPGIDPDTQRVTEMPQLPGVIPGLPNIPTVDVPVSGVTTRPARNQPTIVAPGATQPAGNPRQARAARMLQTAGGTGSSRVGGPTNNSA